MFGEILDALAKPIRDGALSSLRGGPSGGLVAQLEEIVGKYDALRGQPPSSAAPASASSPAPAPAPASATKTERPKRTPLPYELEIERMCAGDVREQGTRRGCEAEATKPKAAKSETSERTKSEPRPREAGSIPFERPDPGLVALLEEIDRLDTFGFLRRPPVRSKPASTAESEQAEPAPAETTEPASPERPDQPACNDSLPCAAEPEPSSIDRRRLARARVLRRRRVLALARNLRRDAKPRHDHPAMPEQPTHVSTSASQQPIARGPP